MKKCRRILAILGILLARAGSVTTPASNPSELQAVAALKSKLPPDAVVLAPWDFEYFSKPSPDTQAYHQKREVEYFPVTYFVSKALASEDFTTMSRLLRFAAAKADFKTERKPLAGIPSLAREFSSISEMPALKYPTYFVLTDGMVKDFGIIHMIGTWDIRNAKGSVAGYKSLRCHFVPDKELTINCSGIIIDLNEGKFPDGTEVLARSVIVKDGKVVFDKTFPNSPSENVLEAVISDGKLKFMLLMDAAHYRSAFNSLYLLSMDKNDSFQRVDVGLPEIQAFQLR